MATVLKERTRRHLSTALMYLGWTASLVLTWLRIDEMLPPRWGALSLISIAVAVAATLVRSRYRLQDSIVSALRIGMQAQREEGLRIEADNEARDLARDAVIRGKLHRIRKQTGTPGKDDEKKGRSSE